MGRREHNEHQVRAFCDKYYPNSAPGSPDPDQSFDDNKKGSRVILKGPSYKRIDSHYGSLDDEGNETPAAINESHEKLLKLIRDRSGELSDLHQRAARQVLLNVNTAGGFKEMERLEEMGRKVSEHRAEVKRLEKEEYEASGKRQNELKARLLRATKRGVQGKIRDGLAAADIARTCRTVITFALDELDKEHYWLDVGTDETYASKRQEEAQKRSREAAIDRHESYRRIYPKWLALVESGWSKEAAKFELAKQLDTYPTRIKEAIAFCREEEQEKKEREAC